MAKSKMIEAIKTSSEGLNVALGALATKAKDGTATPADVTSIHTRVVAMRTAVNVLKAHTKKWDGSTSLKNLFKSKEKLRESRTQALNFLAASEQTCTYFEDKVKWITSALEDIRTINNRVAH